MTLAPVFDRARPIADAVLWEGYVLYPYRRSAAKNQLRFQWGVVGPAEQPRMACTVVLDAGVVDEVAVRVRFLQLHRRADGWDEAEAVERDVTVSLTPGQRCFDVASGVVTGSVHTTVAPDGAFVRLGIEVVNDVQIPDGDRPDALLRSFVGCHLVLATADDVFVSLLEPPAAAAAAVGRAEQHRCWPVLVGPAPRRDVMLVSPVILYDYPSVAAESPGDFFDGTEIDEMLTLRVQTMTDDEKAEARATDPRAAAVVDRCDAMAPDVLAALHGSGRAWNAVPADPHPDWSEPGPPEVLIGGTVVTRGSKVTLHPMRRADAHDMFLVGRMATVAEVVHDVDGDVHVAVTVDDDPAAAMWDAHGRYLYFAPDELRPAAPIADRPHRVLVAGVGNIFRSDDGFGSEVVRRLEQLVLPEGARVVDYGIRGVHLAFDLADGVDLLILVDTVPDAGGPGAVTVAEVDARAFGQAAVDAHDLDPNAVFRSLGILGDAAPRTLVVGCQPVTLDDGIGLSDEVAAAVAVAADKVVELLERALEGSP